MDYHSGWKHLIPDGFTFIKEKYGLLIANDPEGRRSLTIAQKSQTVCSKCGKAGGQFVSVSGWISTLCEEHSDPKRHSTTKVRVSGDHVGWDWRIAHSEDRSHPHWNKALADWRAQQ